MQQIYSKIRVLLVEDEEVSRLGVTLLLRSQAQIDLVDAVATIDDALTVCANHIIHVVLLDLYLNDKVASDRLADFFCVCNNPKILLFTSAKNISKVHVDAITKGASGLVIKSQPLDTLLKAIELVSQGDAWFDRNIISHLLMCARQNHTFDNIINSYMLDTSNPGDFLVSDKDQTELFEKLTQREKQITHLAIDGMSNQKIAVALSISEKTVRNNLSSIYGKFDVANRLQLCLKARKTQKPHRLL